MERLIRNVKKEVWKELRSEAIRHEMRMGEFLDVLLREHRERGHERGWDAIFSRKRRMLTDKEAEEMRRILGIFERPGGFEE
ncbi:MAG: hypothetical protein HY520_03280 [Candidatus Aenigmarchaeota archaeon]|nr:hypothetical protein [Candidatus Aenigmarchaeota archaeon]